MKKRLIHFDSDGYERKKSLVLMAVDAANNAIEAYNDLGVGNMDADSFKQAKQADTTGIEFSISKAIFKELDRSGITIKSIRQASVEHTIEDYRGNVQPLFQILKIHSMDAPSLGYSNDLIHTTFTSGKVEFTKSNDAELKAKFETWLETEAAERLYTLQHEVANKLNDLAAMIGIEVWRLPANLFAHVFELHDNVIHSRPLIYNNAKALEPEIIEMPLN